MLEAQLIKGMSKGMIAIFGFFLVIFLMFFLLIGSLAGVSSANAITLQSVLSTTGGNEAYTSYFRPVIEEYMKKKKVTIDLAWLMTPYLYTEGFDKITIDEVKKIAESCIKRDNEKYILKSFDDYYSSLIQIEKFKKINKDDLKKFIETNSESNAIYYGNMPEKINEFKKMKLGLPVEEIGSYYDIGMYDPFDDGLHMHYGVDISVVTGTPVLATFDGAITYSGYDSISGNMIIISTGDLHVAYAHLRELPSKKVGDNVKLGEVIAYSGATGNVTGAHLHFQACAAKTTNVFEDCINKQKETFFNPKLLWDF